MPIAYPKGAEPTPKSKPRPKTLTLDGPRDPRWPQDDLFAAILAANPQSGDEGG